MAGTTEPDIFFVPKKIVTPERGSPGYSAYILRSGSRRRGNVFVCDGKNDQVEWQAALDYLEDHSFGSIWVEPGAYNWNPQSGQAYGVLWPNVDDPAGFISLVGDSKNDCVVNFKGSAATDIALKIGAVGGGSRIEGIRFESTGTACKGISTTGGGQWSKAIMRELYFHDFVTGIEITQGHWSRYEGLRFQACSTGMEWTPNNDTNHNTVINCFTGTCTTAGMKLRGQKNTLINDEFNDTSPATALWLAQGGPFQLIGCGEDSAAPNATRAFKIESGVKGWAVGCWGTKGWQNDSDVFRILQSYDESNIPLCEGGTRVIRKAAASDLFDAVGLSDSVTIWTQPANTMLKAAYIGLVKAFSGGGVTSLTITLGDAGDTDGLLVAGAMNLSSGAPGATYKSRGVYWNWALLPTAGWTASAKPWLAYSAGNVNLNTITGGEIIFVFDYE